MEDSSEKPLKFASCSLSPGEKKYAQLDKGLAIVFGVKKFHKYLLGQKFIIHFQIDHKPLKYLFSATCPVFPLASAQIQRQGYCVSMSISYKPGENHKVQPCIIVIVLGNVYTKHEVLANQNQYPCISSLFSLKYNLKTDSKTTPHADP